jgi:hypothetical protein
VSPALLQPLVLLTLQNRTASRSNRMPKLLTIHKHFTVCPSVRPSESDINRQSCRRLHSCKPRKVWSSPNIIRLSKSGRMRTQHWGRSIPPHAVRSHGDLHSFFTSAVDWMSVSFTPRSKSPRVPIAQEAGWPPVLVWMTWIREKLLAPTGNRNTIPRSPGCAGHTTLRTD